MGRLREDVDRLQIDFEARLHDLLPTFERHHQYVLPSYFLEIRAPSWSTFTISEFSNWNIDDTIQPQGWALPLETFANYPMSRPVTHMSWAPRLLHLANDGLLHFNCARALPRTAWRPVIQQALADYDSETEETFWERWQ